ncbi:hypothetical protein pdam_00025509, partial [Pocillopora damicornis]
MYLRFKEDEGHLEYVTILKNIQTRGFIGVLSSRGLPVQCWRASNCLQRLDPLGTALRWQYD